MRPCEPKHQFRLYEGERFNEMVESIKDYGILSPLTVIPLPPDEIGGQYEYEVFIGHNRLECGKVAGLTEVPCIIREDLTVEEIDIISKISNLLQRGFSDLPHSERAEAIAAYYNAIKHQGRRTDLIPQVEALINGETADNTESADGDTSSPSGNKSIDVAGEKFGLSKNSVARYIRLNNLINGLKEYLDSEELAIRAGVSLSYIEAERQHTIHGQMKRYEVCPSMKQAEQLRKLNADTPDDADDGDNTFLLGCADILLGRGAYDKEQKPKKTINFKLDRSAVSSYFKENDTEEEIQETVMEALQFYHQFRDKYMETENP